MTMITNTFTTYTAKGLREDLSDVIYNIDPVETPFMTGISRNSCMAVYHEWQTDHLDNADGTNAQVQGDDVTTFDVINPTLRLGNYTQISRKTVIISGTEEVVDKAGRRSEMGYQVARKGKSLKRDIETILLQNQARAAGTVGATPAKLASVLAWLTTNISMGTGAAASPPSPSDGTVARTDGTQAAFTETMLKTVLQSIFTNSGDEPDMVLVGAKQKTVFSTFTGNNTRYINADEEKLTTSIDVYVYDFGSVKVVPDRFMRVRDALVINSDLWAISWLRPIRLEDLAKTGDAQKKLMLGEYTLEARNEAGSGGVFDLT
jgi:hypothetical protein